VARVTLENHRGRLKNGVGSLSNGELLVVGLLGRDDGSKGRHHEVDTGVSHEDGLELGKIDIEGTVKAEGGGEGRENVADEAVQVSTSWCRWGVQFRESGGRNRTKLRCQA
jgi:hypothetical protein